MKTFRSDWNKYVSMHLFHLSNLRLCWSTSLSELGYHWEICFFIMKKKSFCFACIHFSCMHLVYSFHFVACSPTGPQTQEKTKMPNWLLNWTVSVDEVLLWVSLSLPTSMKEFTRRGEYALISSIPSTTGWKGKSWAMQTYQISRSSRGSEGRFHGCFRSTTEPSACFWYGLA